MVETFTNIDFGPRKGTVLVTARGDTLGICLLEYESWMIFLRGYHNNTSRRAFHPMQLNAGGYFDLRLSASERDRVHNS